MNNIDFSRIKIEMPSPEDLKASYTKTYDEIGFTFIDNWPKAWREASMATELIEIDHGLIDVMYGDLKSQYAIAAFAKLEPLARCIDNFCDWEPAFIRLNTRSPKDVIDVPVTCAGRQALSWIMSSERCLDDLVMLSYAEKPAYVAVRQYVLMRPYAELRCFVVDDELRAVSQYFYDKTFQILQDDEWRGDVWRHLDKFADEVMIANTDQEDFVFDVAVVGNPEDVLLIEVNPYGLSDPCCATYEQIEEKGGWFYK